MFRLISLCAVLAATSVFAHARLKLPAPRNNSDLLKDPNGPCGNVARTATPKVYTAGQTIDINFEETVNHDGCFTFALSQQNDTNFVVLKMVAHSNVGMLPRQYTTTANLPAGVTCTDCTLQQIQYMLPAGSACPPATPPAGSRYFSCADVRIVAPDAGSAGGGAGGSGGAGGAGGAGGGAAGGTGGSGGAGGGAAGGTGGSAGGAAGGSGGSGGAGGAGGSTMTADAGKGGSGGTGGGTPSATGGNSGGVISGEDPGAGCSTAPVFSGLSVLVALGLGLRRRK